MTKHMMKNDDLQFKIDSISKFNLDHLQKEYDLLLSKSKMLEYRCNFYNHLFNSSPDSILVIRLDDGYLIDANEHFQAFFGYSKDEFRNIKLDDFLLGNRLKMIELAMTSLKGNGRFQSDCDLKRKDGNIVSAQISANLTVVDEDEGVYMIVSIQSVR